jgi:hypothetical protein
MTEIENLIDGVEAVGRFDEQRHGRHSPFHLTACGGCGCPAFQQPCSLCGYYPMGADKGYYSPKEATREMFCTMVDRSGPGGRDGTIATWHAVARKRRYEDKNTVALAASEIELPTAAEYWDAVVLQDARLHRKTPERFASRAWTAIDDIGQLAMGGFCGVQPSMQSTQIFAAIRGWVEALHSEDREEIRSSFSKLRQVVGIMRYEYSGNGNMRSAIRNLDEAIELFESDYDNKLSA